MQCRIAGRSLGKSRSRKMNGRLDWGLGVFQESHLSLTIDGFEENDLCSSDSTPDAYSLIQGQSVTINVHITPGPNTSISNETFLEVWRKYLPSIGVDLQVFGRQNLGEHPTGNPLSPAIMLRKSVSVEMVPCTDAATKAVFIEKYDSATQTLSLAVTTAIQVQQSHLNKHLFLELGLVVRTIHESDLHMEEYESPSQDATERLVRNIFQFSRATPPKIPSKSARVSIRVIEPVKLTSSTHPLHSDLLINLRYENTHPQYAIKLLDAHFHLENTERVHHPSHQRTLSPARIQLSVLQAVNENARLGESPNDTVIHYASLYDCAWVEKPINVVLEPGEAYSSVVKIRPKEFDGTSKSSRPRGQDGNLKTPLTTEWCLATSASLASFGAQVHTPVVSHTPPYRQEVDTVTKPRPSLAAMHIIRWKTHERSHQEVFIHIRGPDDVHTHEEFEVTVAVTNTAPTSKLLWLLVNVPVNAETHRLLKEQYGQGAQGDFQLPTVMEGGLVPHENIIQLGIVHTSATVQANVHLMPLRQGLSTLQPVWLFDPNNSIAYEMQIDYSVFVQPPSQT